VDSYRIRLQNRSARNVDTARVLETARFVFHELGLHPNTELSISLVTLSEMERLHIQHMDEPGATDVLSFPFDELRAPTATEPARAGNLGDIVLCPDLPKSRQLRMDSLLKRSSTSC
jgi:probable rRNA maturation factor